VIALRGVSKRFGGAVALDGVSLDVPAGSTHVLLGSSGSGKSTIRLAARLDELAAMADLDRGALGRYPRDLSGGQRQRVGLMRALREIAFVLGPVRRLWRVELPLASIATAWSAAATCAPARPIASASANGSWAPRARRSTCSSSAITRTRAASRAATPRGLRASAATVESSPKRARPRRAGRRARRGVAAWAGDTGSDRRGRRPQRWGGILRRGRRRPVQSSWRVDAPLDQAHARPRQHALDAVPLRALSPGAPRPTIPAIRPGAVALHSVRGVRDGGDPAGVIAGIRPTRPPACPSSGGRRAPDPASPGEGGHP